MPAAGTGPPVEVAPGVWRFRIPLRLPTPDHLHVHVIDGGARPVVVDTGVRGSEDALRAGLSGVIGDRDFDVLVTHGHIDHWGLASALKPTVLAHPGCGPSMGFTSAEAFSVAEGAAPGWPSAADLGAAFDGFGRLVSGTPDIHPLADGDRLGPWEVLWTPGHDPGHICLWRARDGVLLCGDLLLPDFTPNIQPAWDGGDALADFLASLERVASLPVQLVLPAHGEPFTDAAGRARQLQEFHRARLRRLECSMRSSAGATTGQLAEELFSSADHETADEMLATLETLAHLEHLRQRGVVACDDRGRWSIAA
jgi:glyoxylase-like metal-dependent hydrolase (beta-lactamase superfamily II)